MKWTTACPDWEKRIVERQSLIACKPLFPDVAADALDVFGHLTMVDAGGVLMKDACEPWVMDLVAVIFGSYNPETKRRLITNYFLMVSKKNGKSTIAAAIMLTALILNQRASGEYIILAPTKEAADNAYKPIRDMIAADPDLTERFHEQGHVRVVTDRVNKATLKVVAADDATVTGKKAIGVFVDELWEFGNKPRAAAMLTEATGGLASRPEGFVFYCTTQSNQAPAGVFKDKLSYARNIRDGKIDAPHFLPVIYEFPRQMVKDQAYKDLKNAYVTNPNWGVSVDAEVIRQKYQEAEAAGEVALLDFYAKHLNVEIGLALGSDTWAGANFWLQNGYEEITLDYILANCEVCTVGIDGGGLKDLLGLAVIGRHSKTKDWLHWGHAWAHPSVLESQKQIAPTLLDFAKQGHLTLVSQIGEDVEQVADIVEKVERAGLLDLIGVDTAGISDIDDAIRSRKIHDVDNRIKGVPQGWRMTGTVKTVERQLAGGTFKHGAQPLLAWAVGNSKVVASANAILITKEASGSGKIDPVMALLDAAMLMGQNPQPRKKKLVLAVGG